MLLRSRTIARNYALALYVLSALTTGAGLSHAREEGLRPPWPPPPRLIILGSFLLSTTRHPHPYGCKQYKHLGGWT